MNEITLPEPVINSTGKATLNNLYGCSLALAVAELSARHEGPLAVFVEDVAQAFQLAPEIDFFMVKEPIDKDRNVFHLQDWETLPYDVCSPHQEIVADRLRVLSRLPQLGRGSVLVLPLEMLLQRLTPFSYISGNVFSLHTGQTINLDDFRAQLQHGGYRAVSQVLEHGEYAVRGSIVDIFPSSSQMPLRLDLFDDEIDTIRFFDPESQRSLEPVDQLEILPAREFPFNKAAIAKFREAYRTEFEGDPLGSTIYTSISDGFLPGGIEYYLPLFFDQLESIFDYLSDTTLFVIPPSLKSSIDYHHAQIRERYEQRRHNLERPVLAPVKLYLGSAEILGALETRNTLVFSRTKVATQTSHEISPAPELTLYSKNKIEYGTLETYVNNHRGRILFTAESKGRREVMLERLRDCHIYPRIFDSWSDFLSGEEKTGLIVGQLFKGAHFDHVNLTILTETALFGERAEQGRRRKQRTRDAESVINNLTDLHIGDPVVHEEHGVGRYLGLSVLEIDRSESEYLTIEYADGDKLYVPVASLQLINRYTGSAPEQAPLHKLGTETWQRIKRKAAEKIRDIAAEILDIHAKRAMQNGFQYDIHHDEYDSFASAFPFEETPDQEKAIDTVVADMSDTKPMDRVICGDVGFGKTEVAMRAAFIAANSNKQVAVLVPTTLLAQQHFQNFCDRFADWPIKIESLSRFNSQKHQKNVIENLANGKIDIVIGTHKLLQSNIKFENLGLVIIDEEHRFGVKQKDQFKAMRASVDILTLTATPIPRTLNMSLSGLRDLSIIATPPAQRHSIQTYICEWNNELIREACTREIHRGGQVYVLHNRIETIEKTTDRLKKLIPEASIHYAHGQMREKELERIMLDFYHQRFNILVCTTIIESGIDIPSANTIIIDRADKLGLAQLHQIRGRVGRSHHRAYAYLVTPPVEAISKNAQKRLEAIESLQELGIGFTLATHDLEIRGAGELLGDDQSGQIHEIGFHMYTELLERTIKSMKEGEMSDDIPAHAHVEINLGVPALLPDDYIHDVHTRLILYKRIASADTRYTLDDIKSELVDRFGALPVQASNLFMVTRLKQDISHIGIRKIDSSSEYARLVFRDNARIDPGRLIQMIQENQDMYKFNGKDTLHIYRETESCEEAVNMITSIVSSLCFREAA